jgi:dTDP-4-dehydrorhamnose reductase
MKRILVCGSNGLLGQKLAWMLSVEQEFEVLHTSHHRTCYLGNSFDYTQLDISNRSDVKSLITSYRPDIIINPAAMANVDQCEKEREAAWKINVNGVENLVEISRRIGSKLIHISTDYVFDGKNGPYKENDRVNPINYYGKTKLAGENLIISGGIDFAILRTILIYGTGNSVKNNFGLWVINSLKGGKTIRCADDQFSSPTHVKDIAAGTIASIKKNVKGVFHICGAEQLSRYDFAIKAADIFSFDRSYISSVKSVELKQEALRPLVTGFFIDKARNELGFHPMNVTEGLLLLKQELGAISMN